MKTSMVLAALLLGMAAPVFAGEAELNRGNLARVELGRAVVADAEMRRIDLAESEMIVRKYSEMERIELRATA